MLFVQIPQVTSCIFFTCQTLDLSQDGDAVLLLHVFTPFVYCIIQLKSTHSDQIVVGVAAKTPVLPFSRTKLSSQTSVSVATNTAGNSQSTP